MDHIYVAYASTTTASKNLIKTYGSETSRLRNHSPRTKFFFLAMKNMKKSCKKEHVGHLVDRSTVMFHFHTS
jgi:hypothetical protein